MGAMIIEIVRQQRRARHLAAQLVEASVWFEVTPLPDDFYEFRVKDDCSRALLVVKECDERDH